MQLASQSQHNPTAIHFAPLGSQVYKEKIAGLEKYTVPKKYTDKASQAWYDEILTGRNKHLLSAFKEDEIIHDSLLLEKCNSIFKKIIVSNKAYNFDGIQLYINRSPAANAVCYGEGTIMVNLGLFLWIDNDDELALILGHELAHQLLLHGESHIAKSISTLTSQDFKDEIKDIKRADYGKFERFRNLMKGLSMESGKHSRYKETEADSLGVVFARNAGFDIGKGSVVILKLDKVDELLTAKNLYTVRSYFEKAPIEPASYFKTKSTYKGLSSVAVTMNADKDMDSIKTHPDCSVRYKAMMGTQLVPSINCCNATNSFNQPIKERAMLEIVRYLYENNAIGLCTHISMFAIKNNYDPSIYNRFLSLCFSKLYYKDKNLDRFNVANTYANRETTLKELQDFLFAVGSKDLDALALYFLNLSNTESEDDEFARMMYQIEVKEKERTMAYALFNKKFPNNKYQYLLQTKTK